MCPTPQKCATIFRDNGRYSFLCFYCDDTFDNFNTIVEHIEGAHFSDYNDAKDNFIDVKIESTLFESFQDDYHSDGGQSSAQSTEKKFNPNIFNVIKEQIEEKIATKCSLCQNKFLNDLELIDHLLYDHGNGGSLEKPYNCEKCKKQFSEDNDYLNHLKYNHSVNVNGLLTKMYCDICNKDFTSKQRLRSHLLYHVKSKYSCKRCPATYNVLKLYRAHLLQHNAPKERKIYSCELCNKEFTKKSNMKQHLECVHLGLDKRICEICAKTFKYDKSYKEHMQKHTGYKPFKCEYCEKQFCTRKQLRFHINLHHTTKSFDCDICAKSYKCEAYLRKHILEEHSGRQFFCTLCDFESYRKSSLQKHRKVCTERTLYPCHLCTLVFKTKILLDMHIGRKHIEKPSYECLACHRKFKTIGPLNTHMNQQHSTRMHVCDQCGKSFKCDRYLKNHQEVMHNSQPKIYKCTLCNLEVKRKTSLSKHYENMHSNLPNRFACEQCPQTFKHKQTYIHHIRTHTGEKNYINTHFHIFFTKQLFLQVKKIINVHNVEKCTTQIVY